jgi:hypothetical protein
MDSAERATALRNKGLNLAKTCRSGLGPASERTSHRDNGTPSHAILSGRRRSAPAELGWIVVATGLVLEDRRKAWVHTLAGTNGDMSRFGVMHPCAVGRSTESDQKAEGQNRTHLLQSTSPRSSVVRGPRRRNLYRSQDRSNWACTTSRCRSRTCAATSKCLAPHFRNWALSRHQFLAKVRFAPMD